MRLFLLPVLASFLLGMRWMVITAPCRRQRRADLGGGGGSGRLGSVLVVLGYCVGRAEDRGAYLRAPAFGERSHVHGVVAEQREQFGGVLLCARVVAGDREGGSEDVGDVVYDVLV